MQQGFLQLGDALCDLRTDEMFCYELGSQVHTINCISWLAHAIRTRLFSEFHRRLVVSRSCSSAWVSVCLAALWIRPWPTALTCCSFGWMLSTCSLSTAWIRKQERVIIYLCIHKLMYERTTPTWKQKLKVGNTEHSICVTTNGKTLQHYIYLEETGYEEWKRYRGKCRDKRGVEDRKGTGEIRVEGGGKKRRGRGGLQGLEG